VNNWWTEKPAEGSQKKVNKIHQEKTDSGHNSVSVFLQSVIAQAVVKPLLSFSPWL
jgi:hypothetical protein